jgi:hypothetical protein
MSRRYFDCNSVSTPKMNLIDEQHYLVVEARYQLLGAIIFRDQSTHAVGTGTSLLKEDKI